VWHASIAVCNRASQSRAVVDWSPKQRDRALRLARKMLGGIGAGETFVKYGRHVVHVRRSLSPEEIGGMDPAWLAIPPVDMAG
jgi:hypothetical protein